MKTNPEQVYNLFFEPGEVVEIRALGLGGQDRKVWEGFARGDGIVFGYFDNAADFAQSALALDAKKPGGVYFTLNPVQPELISRVKNRLVAATRKRPSTKEKEIRCIRWLPIDLDPKRFSEISSTEEELDHARGLGAKVAEWLRAELGFPDHVGAMSGNGFHIVYRLPDLPNTAEVAEKSTGIVARALRALRHKFADEQHPVEVDCSVGNASRIWKLYGTYARKGDSTPDRPHREAYLFKNAPQKLADVPVVSREQLERLAALAPKEKAARPPAPARKAGGTQATGKSLGPLDLDAYLAHYGVAVKKKETRENGSTWFILEECLFDPSHKREAAIVQQDVTPFLCYTCYHDSCKGYRWKEDARPKISGNDNLARFCEGYDPNWPPPARARTGLLDQYDITIQDNIVSLHKNLPSAQEINPDEFFEKSGKGDKFSPFLMVKYLMVYLHPIVHTSGIFWRYSDGVWQEFPPENIHQVAAVALHHRVSEKAVIDSRKILAHVINRPESEWEVQDHLINVLNGMVDISNLPHVRLIPHNSKYGSRSQLPVNYDEQAVCERWESFLQEIFPEGRDEAGQDGACLGLAKENLLQEYMGYCLLKTCKFERCLFCYGTGANGKSTVLNTIEDVVGSDNATSISIDDLSKNFNVPYLHNKMINVASEVESKEPAGTEVLKKCISGDLISGEWKYGKKINFRNSAKFIFAMNNPPTINDKSHGFVRKVLVLNFQRRLQEHEMDRELGRALVKERDGIFMWMLYGAVDLLMQDGFTVSEDLQDGFDRFMMTLNPTLLYLEEMIVVGPTQVAPASDLYVNYTNWCKDSGHRALGKSNFYAQVLMKYPQVRKDKADVDNSRRHCFIGLGLRVAEEIV